MNETQKIVPSLWFDRETEEAVNLIADLQRAFDDA